MRSRVYLSDAGRRPVTWQPYVDVVAAIFANSGVGAARGSGKGVIVACIMKSRTLLIRKYTHSTLLSCIVHRPSCTWPILFLGCASSSSSSRVETRFRIETLTRPRHQSLFRPNKSKNSPSTPPSSGLRSLDLCSVAYPAYFKTFGTLLNSCHHPFQSSQHCCPSSGDIIRAL